VQWTVGRTALEVNMNSNVLEIALRNARRVTHLGRVFFLGDCGFRGLAYLQNLSTTGCQVISESPLQVGMEVQLSLVAASDQRDILIEMAKVRWTNGDCYGLEFLGIDPLERERLRLFLKTK
jgi:PilZ domain-containing protein